MQQRDYLVRIVKRAFGKEPTISGDTVKVNVQEVNLAQIYDLHRIAGFTDDIKLKRSGTGITVIVTAKP